MSRNKVRFRPKGSVPQGLMHARGIETLLIEYYADKSSYHCPAEVQVHKNEELPSSVNGALRKVTSLSS